MPSPCIAGDPDLHYFFMHKTAEAHSGLPTKYDSREAVLTRNAL